MPRTEVNFRPISSLAQLGAAWERVESRASLNGKLDEGANCSTTTRSLVAASDAVR